MKKLSICIVTLKSRKQLLDRMMAILTPQLTGDIELVMVVDDGEESYGKKCNNALQISTSEYLVWLDDDDIISECYVSKIMEALKSGPDCVGFRARKYIDGEFAGDMTFSLKCKRWTNLFLRDMLPTGGKERIYSRPPNHITPIRRSLAIQSSFDDKRNFAADMSYAYGLQRLKLLKREVFIDDYLYFYYYRSVPTRTEKMNDDYPH